MRRKIFYLSWTFLWVFLLGCATSKTTPTRAEKEADTKLVDLGTGICQDASNGLMWMAQKSDYFLTWEEAKAYADRLEYGEYADWRLPTKNELYRLHDIFFWKKNGNCRMQTSGSYWYESEGENISAGYWETYYLCSPEYKFVDTPDKGMVRAVRP
jgi:hypothetical protein